MKLNELFDLKGKTAIVTGGARGIGRFISNGLAEAGANIVIASRKLEICEETVSELEKQGVKALAVKCDMLSIDDIENLVHVTVEKFGRIDVLFNNAGITWGAPTLDFPLDKWEKVFNVNVRGLWALTQKTANIMKENGGGKIINISSVVANKGTLELSHPAVAYNSSKAAVESLTKNLAIKLADYNITVNAIAPGFFRTDMMEWIFDENNQRALDGTLATIPAKRVAGEDDMKGLAVFLASKASDYLTGAIIPVDGGMSAQ